ncbi:MAG: TonB-dependent receptor [Pseudomonadota bacterium]
MGKKNFASLRARLLCGAGVVLSGIALCAAPAHAQAAQAQATDSASSSEVITVTGSRLSQRGFDAPSPVTVIGQEDVQLSGTTNLETLLSSAPQFVASINGGPTSNTVPGGSANVNLRGFGPQRNLVLVNGRRFAIQGPDQTVDLNTIPSSLVRRTEIVTGGSSAVYGSDAITGVVNFIMRDDFEGLEISGQHLWDQPTNSPTNTIDITFGGNFDNNRGNVVVSVNYLNRAPITRGERGGWTFYSNADGCVTPASFSTTMPGVPLAVPSGQTCRQAGGIPGIINSGSGDIPNSRISGLPTYAAAPAALQTLYANAGLTGLGGFGVTFNDAGDTARPALDPDDRYNLGPENYLQIPQERWMVNAFSHYDLTDKATAYMEFNFSNNTVNMQLAPTNIGTTVLLNTNNPYLSAPMQAILGYLDAQETGTTTVVSGSASRTNSPNDGFAAVTLGRRFTGLGDRFNSSERVAWRSAFGVRGDLGSMSPNFLRDLHYDMYYIYARTDETDHQQGNVSRSRYQAALLESGTAAPVCDVFGQNIDQACINAIGISATNITKSEMQNAAATLSGSLFDVPAGPVDFSLGAEWRYSKAAYSPDTFLSSGDVAGFNAGLPTNGSEAVKEVFGEVRVPLLAGLPFIDKLAANAAFRDSDYNINSVGNVWTYSYGLDWRVTSDVAFRGQYQQATRAPSVGELFGGQALNFDIVTDPCGANQPSGSRTTALHDLCVATGVPAANVWQANIQQNPFIPEVTGGNPSLESETSDTKTFGVVLTPSVVPHLALSLDWYDIKVDGAIAPFGGSLANVLNLCYNVLKDPNSLACHSLPRQSDGEIALPNPALLTNANAGGYHTSGIDLNGNYTFDIGWGLFDNSSSLNINTSWNYTHEWTFTPLQDQPNIRNPCVGSYGTTCGDPIPNYKGTTRFTWTTGPLSLSLRHRYIGEVTVDKYLIPLRTGGTPPAFDSLVNPVFAAQSYFDLAFSYEVGEHGELYGGINNVDNKDPPVAGSSQVRANTWPATYDTNGRVFFVGATVKFH